MVSNKVLTNTLATIIWQLSLLILGIIFTPYLLNNLGAEKFGVWVLFNSIISSINLLDIGFGSGLSIFVSEANSKKNYREINEIIYSGLLVYSVFIFFLIILFILRWEIIKLLKIPEYLIHESVIVMSLLLLVAGINNIMLVFRSFLIGIQNIVYPHLMGVIGQVLFYTGCIFVLNQKLGLIGISIWYTLINFLLNIVFIVSILKIYKFLTPWKFFPQLRIFKKLFSFGIKFQIVRITQVLNSQLNKILSGTFIDMTTVSMYDVALRIANLIKIIPYTLLYSLIPRIAEFDLDKDKERIFDTYKNMSRYIFMIVIPIIVFIILYSDKIIFIWLGRTDFLKSAIIIKIIAIGYIFEILAYPAINTAFACKHPEFEVKKSLVNIFLNILLCTSLILSIGYVGAAIGTSISFIVSGIYFLILFYKNLKFKIDKELITQPSLFLFSSSVSALLVYFLKFNISNNRLQHFIILILYGLIYFLIYAIILFLMKIFKKEDVEVAKKILSLEFLKSQ